MISNIFSKDIAIDMGTCYTRIISAGSGISVYEPTMLARDKNSGEVVAVGSEAKEMEGKCPPSIKLIKPVENGVISDFDNVVALLKIFFQRTCEKSIIKPRVIITLPECVTEVEKRAVIDAVTLAGARRTFLLDASLAAASGANCDVSLARGMMIADIGGGRTDIAALSVGHACTSHSINTAGNSFTDATIKYIKSKYDMIIGRNTAETLKTEIGCVYAFDLTKSYKVCGTDATTGFPRSVTLSSEELREAYEDTLQIIILAVKATLEDTPPELLGDILEDGILLTGGGAALYGIDRRIRMALGIKVFLAENNDLCAVMGAGVELAKLAQKPSGIKNQVASYLDISRL